MRAAVQELGVQLREPPLDEIDRAVPVGVKCRTNRGCWGEPVANGGGLVAGGVVEHEVHAELGRYDLVDRLEAVGRPPLVPSSRVAAPYDRHWVSRARMRRVVSTWSPRSAKQASRAEAPDDVDEHLELPRVEVLDVVRDVPPAREHQPPRPDVVEHRLRRPGRVPVDAARDGLAADSRLRRGVLEAPLASRTARCRATSRSPPRPAARRGSSAAATHSDRTRCRIVVPLPPGAAHRWRTGRIHRRARAQAQAPASGGLGRDRARTRSGGVA